MKRIIGVVILLGFIVCFLLLFYNWFTRGGTEQSSVPTLEAEVLPPATIPATVIPLLATSQSPTSVPSLTPSSTPSKGSSRIFAVDQMEEVFVPAGAFLMGSTDLEAKIMVEDGRAYPEIPQHTVILDGFWIDKYEVTNGMYELCVNAGWCKPPYVNHSDIYSDYFGNPEFSNFPVIWVSWYQAGDYCAWAGRRLPTEAEWEKAARGTEGEKYPWGNEPISGERANLCDINCPRSIANPIYNDGYAEIAPVGSYPDGASPYGAMDMAGNISEWTSTLVQPYPYDANDGREDPDSTAERVWRSSPWSNGFWWLRTTVRYRSVPGYQRNVLGFRCASSD
ncbi:MAG: formylglycine-generating enzyme family protein [Anaerolineaceae bacterium]